MRSSAEGAPRKHSRHGIGGIAKGAGALGGGIFGGTAALAVKFFSVWLMQSSRVFSWLTLDPQYMHHRDLVQSQSARAPLHGVILGWEVLEEALRSSAGDLVRKPLDGSRRGLYRGDSTLATAAGGGVLGVAQGLMGAIDRAPDCPHVRSLGKKCWVVAPPAVSLHVGASRQLHCMFAALDRCTACHYIACRSAACLRRLRPCCSRTDHRAVRV